LNRIVKFLNPICYQENDYDGGSRGRRQSWREAGVEGGRCGGKQVWRKAVVEGGSRRGRQSSDSISRSGSALIPEAQLFELRRDGVFALGVDLSGPNQYNWESRYEFRLRRMFSKNGLKLSILELSS
jgi:hypothetical protein